MLAKFYGQKKEMLRCETSLRSFVKQAWTIMEPGVQFVPGWHIDAICDHLQAVADGDIKRLIINFSPRCGKSSLAAVAFPAATWVKQPHKKFLFSSYDLKLSKRDSRKCRYLIGSDWYQREWNDRFKILSNKGGQDTKERFDNDKGGYRVATSTDSGTTGEGGDIIVYDDPNDIRQMTSDAYIESVIYYHEQVMASRLNDQKTGARICIQQRSNERDLTGHILSKELGWDHLVIPMEYEGSTKVTSIGWSDPRTVQGELMWPDKIGPEQIAEMKRSGTEIGWAGQYQQRPSPGEGAKFKRDWWNFYNPPGVTPLDGAGNLIPVRIKAPDGSVLEKNPVPYPAAFEQVVQGWDLAFKAESESDFVAGHAWGRIGSNVFLLKRDCARRDFPQTLAAIRRMSSEFPCPEKMIEGKANGPAVIQTLKNEIPGIIESPIDKGLIELATSLTGYVEAGNVYLPNPDLFPWVWELIEQFAVFPRGKNDDDISAGCHAWRRLFDSISNGAIPEFRVTPRLGEPDSACHVEPDEKLLRTIPAHWRRWISVVPGQLGAALWICETPKGSLRVYRELSLDGLDAMEAGRKIAERTLPDVRAYMSAIHHTAKWNIDVLLEKAAFTPIEPIGSYAELMEQGLLSYEPTSGEWDDRLMAKVDLRQAKFSAQMVEVEDAAFERLRDLLRFQPVDFEELPYDRKKAMSLRDDINAYNAYMAAVDGIVLGEWPKVKFAASCKGAVAGMGTARRGEDVTDPYLRALLIGISAPPSVMTKKEPKLSAWNPAQHNPTSHRSMFRRRA